MKYIEVGGDTKYYRVLLGITYYFSEYPISILQLPNGRVQITFTGPAYSCPTTRLRASGRMLVTELSPGNSVSSIGTLTDFGLGYIKTLSTLS